MVVKKLFEKNYHTHDICIRECAKLGISLDSALLPATGEKPPDKSPPVKSPPMKS